MSPIVIYTDGACKGNPGPGGYAGLIMYPDTDTTNIVSGGDRHTTNNRMELRAVIESLKVIDSKFDRSNSPLIDLHTDSKYICDAVNKGWLERWIGNNFKGIKNQDLWLQLWKYVCKLNVTIHWVKGHSDNQFNEAVDRLASEACFFQGEPFEYNLQNTL